MKRKIVLTLALLLFGFSFIPETLAQSEDYKLIYGTYFGWGNSADNIISIDVKEGEAYIAGNHAMGVGNVDIYYAKFTKSGRDVEYIHFFGGSANEEITKIRVDGNGNIYLFGKTSSRDMPTKNAFQSKLIGDSDLFIAKLSPNGELIFSTYFGGEYTEEPYDMEVDSEGNVYITGYTRHAWGENNNLRHIPLKNEKIGVEGIKKFDFYTRPFIAKFDTNGNLIFSTYWPLYEINLAPVKDGLYIGGHTVNPDYYTTPGAFDTVCGIKEQKCDPYLKNSDIAITKLDSNLNIVYSTFIGSTGADYLKDLYVDEEGYVYGVGVQAWKNNDFPLKNPSMTKPEGDGADYGIVFKMTPTLSALVYSTYFMREASVHSIRAENGEAYVIGITQNATGSHLTTPNALMPKDTSSLTQNAFFAKLDSNGHILYCTLLGGHEKDYTQREWASEIAVENGEAYIGGYTRAYDFPITKDSFKEEPAKDLSYLAEGYIVKFGFKEYPPQLPKITLNKTISIGESVWGKDIKEVSDGYAILAASEGNPSYPILVKTDKEGNLIWFKKYTNIIGDFPSLAIENDGYLIFGTLEGKATLIKTDLSGNILWSKNYAEHGTFQRGREIMKVQDGYILMGSTNGTWGGSRGVYGELFLVNVDKSGNLLWESYINVEKLGMSPDMMPHQVKKTKDGYIIIGDTVKTKKSNMHRIFVVKTNLEGKEEWVKYLGKNSDKKEDYAVGFSVEVLDNGYLVAGYVYNNLFGGSDLYIARLDLAGNLVWEKVEGKVESDEPVKILKADDGFVLFDRGMENAWTGKKGYFFKFNDRGIKEYSFDIDMPKQDWALNMERVSDGYLLLLSSNSFSNTRDLWLIKVEAPQSTETSTSTSTQISTTSAPTSVQTSFRYRDEFNSLNRDFWWVGEWVTLREAYEKVRIENGILEMPVKETDRNGVVVSKPIKVNKGDIVIVRRRVLAHYANEYFQGGFEFYQTNESALKITRYDKYWLNSYGRRLFAVGYYHYYYEKPGVSLYVPTKNGFAVYGQNWRNAKNYAVFDPIWDNWFEEEIIYDTGTEEVTYKLNGQEGKILAAPYNSSHIRIVMHPYGWYTGHYMKVDWIEVEVKSAKPSEETTTTRTSTIQTSKTSTIVGTENITETAKEIATSATEKAKEVAKGVCGPGMIVAVILLPLILRRKREGA